MQIILASDVLFLPLLGGSKPNWGSNSSIGSIHVRLSVVSAAASLHVCVFWWEYFYSSFPQVIRGMKTTLHPPAQ